MKLSANFSLDEFIRSDTAARQGRLIEPTPEIITNLQRLCIEVLEPLRTWIGGQIVITSGYRPQWLNEAIGGSKKSEHQTGRAADFRVIGKSVFDTVTLAAMKINELPINQLIYEYDQWVHVSVCDEYSIPRRQIITARHINGCQSYTAGIVRQP